MQNRYKLASNRNLGLTLIELMVVIAIIAIIAGIAWPVYQGQSLKNRRFEAIDDLTKIQVFLARCYADNGGYECCDNATMDTFKAANPPPIPPARQYTLTFTPNNIDGGQFACKTAQGYTITAVPGGTQAGDSCDSFTIDHLGNRTAMDGATPKPACWGG